MRPEQHIIGFISDPIADGNFNTIIDKYCCAFVNLNNYLMIYILSATIRPVDYNLLRDCFRWKQNISYCDSLNMIIIMIRCLFRKLKRYLWKVRKKPLWITSFWM